QLGRGRKIFALHLPTLGTDAQLLLEALPLQQVEPAIRARVNEKLEVRVERQLIFRGKDGQLDATISGEENLELGDLLAHIGKGDALALPILRAAKVLDRYVDGGRKLLAERKEEVNDA